MQSENKTWMEILEWCAIRLYSRGRIEAGYFVWAVPPQVSDFNSAALVHIEALLRKPYRNEVIRFSKWGNRDFAVDVSSILVCQEQGI